MKIKLPFIGEVKTGEDAVIKEVQAIKKDLLGGGFLGFPSLSDESRVSGKLLSANKGWVYRNNDVIAKEVSTIEFELYTTRMVGNKLQYNPINTHPLLDALDRFNEFTSASDGFYITQSHKKLTGDAFWYVDGNGPNIKGIYILPPDKITIKVGNIAGNQRVIESYDYKDSIQGKQVTESYLPEQIIHFKAPNPKSYFRGLGAVEAAAADIDMDNLAIEANMQLFKRGLIANFMLSTDKSLTPEQLKQLRAEFKAAYTGIQNAFKVPIVSGGLEPKNLQMSNKDMEFISQQQWVRDKIMSIFGNSKAVLGITEDVNRANAEATIMNWKQTTIRAEMKQITDTLNEFYVPRFGKNLILGFTDPVPEDKEQKITDVASMITSNVITPNEAREILGYEPIQGEDVLRSGLAVPVAPPIPKSLRYVNTKSFLRRSGLYKQLKAYKEARKLTDPIAKKMFEKRAEAQPTKIQSYYDKQIKLVEATEEIFHDKLERFILKLVNKALANVPEEVHQMQQKQLFNEDDEIADAILDFTPVLTQLALAAGTEAMNLINWDKPYLVNDIRPIIEERVNFFAKSLVQTDKEKLIDIITTGVQEGLSIPQIRNNIIEDFDSYSKMQAERITRTEVMYVSNQAALDAFRQSGIVEGKQWLTAGAIDECEQYDGQIVGIDEEFADGDPPLHPNCRCVLLPVTSFEKNLSKAQLKNLRLGRTISELETKIDKRTKKYKELKAKNLEQAEYIKELEDFLDEQA